MRALARAGLSCLPARSTRATDTPTAILIEVTEIDWPGPGNMAVSSRTVASLPPDATPDKVQAARRKLLADRRFFFRCRECEQRMEKGHWWKKGVCQGCATSNHGVIF